MERIFLQFGAVGALKAMFEDVDPMASDPETLGLAAMIYLGFMRSPSMRAGVIGAVPEVVLEFPLFVEGEMN